MSGVSARTMGVVTVLAMLGAWAISGRAQTISLGDRPLNAPMNAPRLQHVALLSDALEAKAGAVQTVVLRFRVEAGFHINSHHPQDELLIPTALTLEAPAGVRVLGIEYPAGKQFRLPSSDEALSVYQDEFRVAVRIEARAEGTTELTGALHYQACDNAACFPPRTLPVRALLTVK